MGAFKNWFRARHLRLRRDFRAAASRSFAALVRGRDAAGSLPDPATIGTVLVVRLNGRMGNTLFMTPMLTAIHEILPDASIDVLTMYPDAGDLLRGLPGIRKIITLPHKAWWNLGNVAGALRSLRATDYDLVIDPAFNSAGDRVAMLLCRARHRLGFGSDEQWLSLDFAASLPPDVRHEALRPLALLQQAFGWPMPPGGARLRVANGTDEVAAGARLLAERLRAAGHEPGPGTTVIGFFTAARGKKDLGPQWWREFWTEYLALRPETVAIEVLPTAAQPAIDERFATVHCPSPRMLAATLAGVDWFFSADTGPMHLASAAGVPTVALFDSTNPAAFGPLKPEDVALRIAGLGPREVAAACASRVAGPPLAPPRPASGPGA